MRRYEEIEERMCAFHKDLEEDKIGDDPADLYHIETVNLLDEAIAAGVMKENEEEQVRSYVREIYECPSTFLQWCIEQNIRLAALISDMVPHSLARA